MSPAKHQPPALKITDLTKSYDGVPVVDQLNLEIAQGEIFGLLGPNGAGKSTTIAMLSGITRIGAGSIEIMGYDVQRDYRISRRLTGIMHQEFVADPFFKIGRALKLHAPFYGQPDNPKWRNQLIDELQLRPHLEKKFIMLSGGLKRRFMIAKALIHRPKLLVLDEPTAGVDITLRQSLWKFVREINAEGTTVLLTTHYLEEAEEMCSRVAIMNHGQIIKLDTVANLLNDFRTESVEILLDGLVPKEATWLREFADKLVLSERSVVIKEDVTDILPVVLQAIKANNLLVTAINSKQKNLEDIFIDQVSR